ncbi:hypothetical protein BZL29_4974 [Mycobacterium kansasii]|uniref:Uncharacterized protein n=1 Tax=Mycobacterium kansasii TaxID=1768 RepID=A0A1V3X1D7_MYCKA|nr:hypothetical protein BZL29_4974 [Mycobacterium kansasii]
MTAVAMPTRATLPRVIGPRGGGRARGTADVGHRGRINGQPTRCVPRSHILGGPGAPVREAG